MKLTIEAKDSRQLVQRVEKALQVAGIKVFNKARVTKRIMKDLAGKSLEESPADTVNSFAKVIAEGNGLVAQRRKHCNEWAEDQIMTVNQENSEIQGGPQPPPRIGQRAHN